MKGFGLGRGGMVGKYLPPEGSWWVLGMSECSGNLSGIHLPPPWGPTPAYHHPGGHRRPPSSSFPRSHRGVEATEPRGTPQRDPSCDQGWVRDGQRGDGVCVGWGGAAVGLAPGAERGSGNGGGEKKRALMGSMCLRCRGELTHTRCRRLLQLQLQRSPSASPQPLAPAPLLFCRSYPKGAGGGQNPLTPIHRATPAPAAATGFWGRPLGVGVTSESLG